MDEDVLEELAEQQVRSDSATLDVPTEANALLQEMRALAEQSRRRPDAKVSTLLAWLQQYACAAIGNANSSESVQWSDKRVIIFTEYADTKRYLQTLLSAAVQHTHRGDERILTMHGGMGDESREQVQRAFNTPPDEHPVRILIATDAAREGVNLQAFCSDLFHYDMPWNPSRLEQRNGRIDRTLQPEPEVRCHYFVFPQRLEDRVLETVMRKIQIVQGELGSAGAVLFDSIERTLGRGLNQQTLEVIESAKESARTAVAEAELESQRKQEDVLAAEIHRAGARLDRSRKSLAVDAESLRAVVDTGLKLAGSKGLAPLSNDKSDDEFWCLPEAELGSVWANTLDLLRPTRQRDETFYEWRQHAARPVTFHALETMNAQAEHLHLSHPLVKRILDRFLSQGFGANDLSRVCAVRVPDENVARVVAYARLTLFGTGAARLHDELIVVAAAWSPTDSEVTPYRDSATAAHAQSVAELALAKGNEAPPEAVLQRLRDAAANTFAQLWSHLEVEADNKASEAKRDLLRRAGKESDDIKVLLSRQQRAIVKARGSINQMALDFGDNTAKDQKRQIELDGQHMDQRLERIEQELVSEPEAIEALYAVRMQRVVPVGMVFAWPESMS